MDAALSAGESIHIWPSSLVVGRSGNASKLSVLDTERGSKEVNGKGAAGCGHPVGVNGSIDAWLQWSSGAGSSFCESIRIRLVWS